MWCASWAPCPSKPTGSSLFRDSRQHPRLAPAARRARPRPADAELARRHARRTAGPARAATNPRTAAPDRCPTRPARWNAGLRQSRRGTARSAASPSTAKSSPSSTATCIRCHDGTTGRPDFRLQPGVSIKTKEVYYINANNLFPPAYLALCAHIRSQTQEGDNNLQPPCNFRISTTELFQILEAGHHGVRLDEESWDRLTTWIDMNRPITETGRKTSEEHAWGISQPAAADAAALRETPTKITRPPTA